MSFTWPSSQCRPTRCFRGSVSRNRRRARSSSLPAQHKHKPDFPAASSSSNDTTTTTTPAPASPHHRTAHPDFTCFHHARPTLPSTTTSQHQLLPAEFRYPSARSLPLRRLTHIVFTCIRLHHQPLAAALRSLRVSTTSSQQPIRLAGDTRPPPA